MNFEGVVFPGNGAAEKMEDEECLAEEMEDCSPPVGMEGCARGLLYHGSNARAPKVVVKERYVEPEYPRLPNEGNLEWQYTMRRTMQEIIPGLFLGPYASATRAKLEEMKAAGLTHIVCVRQNLEKNLIRPNHPGHFKYLVVEIADTATENIIPHFKSVNDFLNECLRSGGKGLVHGNAGISRSAALVIAFIMSKFGVTLKEAFTFVQSKRFCCNPNEGFMAQLREYEPIYRAQHTVPLPLPGDNSNRSSLKRGLESDEADSTTSIAANVVDTAHSHFRFNNRINAQQQTQPFSSSSESSVSSSSESLPHVFNHTFPMVMLPSTQQSDTPMSTS